MFLFATVAGAAGPLLGALARNIQQSTGTGLLVGLGLSDCRACGGLDAPTGVLLVEDA